MTRHVKFVLAALHGLLLIVFVLNAWMSDDSYITFRSVEQFIAGNGLRWNAFERVQAYTSVLWFFLLALFRLPIADIYYAAMLLSLVCCVTTVWLIRKLVVDPISYVALLLLLIASPSVIDFTTSGLENPLGYLLLAMFCWLIFDIDRDSVQRRLPSVLMVAGLAPLVRHDLAILVWPITAFLLFSHRATLRWHAISFWIAAAVSPLLIWTVFSIIYYGSPVPNTALAKLSSGMHFSALVKQGLNYVWISFRDDPVAGLLFVAGLGAAWFRGGIYRAIAASILLHLFYVIKIGGDFMRGRFLSFEVLLAALMLARLWRPTSWRAAVPAAGAAVLFLVLSPFSTLFPASYFKDTFSSIAYLILTFEPNGGVVDEKHGYFPFTSLVKHLLGEAALNEDQRCDRGTPYCVRSEDLRQCPIETPYAKCTQVAAMIGAFGYRAGHTARIIDILALSDPLLARLPPIPGPHRAGHVERKIPRGYIESVTSGQNLIEDKRVAALYDQIKLVTQSDNLFSRARLRAIWLLNTGQLKYLAVGDYL